MRRTACIFCLLALACNSSGAPASSSFGTLPVTGGPAEGASSSSGGSTLHVPEDSTAAAPGSTSTGGTTLVLDVGMPDVGVPGPKGCQGKIDFLFVIARDFNMALLQDKLVAAFPKFIATIESKFADFDYQIMVVDGEPEWGNDFCNLDCTPEGCSVPGYPCDLLDTLTECDTTHGAGTIFNAGKYAPNKPCTLASGKRYIVKGQPDLAGTFQCIAQVGTNGRNRIGESLARAVSPAKTAHCNKGFVRDDALLFVSLIHWGTDYMSKGTPEEWAQAVLDAKHGDANAVVMLDIGPMSDLGWSSLEECADEPSGKTCRLLQHFPSRLLGDNFAPDFGAHFEAAAELVDEACSVFIPR